MGIKFPTTAAPAAKPSTPAPTQTDRDQQYIAEQDAKRRQAASPPTPAAAPARPPAPPPQRHAYPDAGVGEAPPPDPSGGDLPFANTFGNLTAGTHKLLCCVEAITHWRPSEPTVMFRVRVGPERGREIRWDQSPPPYAAKDPDGNAAVYWRRALFGAYAAGGWPSEPDKATGGQGWPRSQGGSYIPPYVDFFVVDVDGVSVPVMLEVTVRVDSGYEKYTKVVAVRQHMVDGVLVQAPMPRKVTPWVAQRHRWEGEQQDIVVKLSNAFPNGAVVPSVKVRFDQIPLGIGGLRGLKDCK
jgi:hypothetical protein